jgi:serine/threonine-protein kinase
VIGSVLDKYEVLQKLGEGATATVYRGRHVTIGRDVAIKVLHPHLSASSRNRERFNREARAVGKLSHQNIVSILDFSGQTGEECYIVTELVDGVTLQRLLEENGRMPSEIAALLGIELCAALGFAHAQRIIHRDLKPENVMIRRDGRVKLMDFGVARVLDEGTITLDGSLLGSPAYMSPQQALDQPLDGRSDLFSLGSVLFHAVTGQAPFAGGNPTIILRNIIDGNRPEVLEIDPAISPQLAHAIDRLLQVNPEDRVASAEEAAELLRAVLDEVALGTADASISLHRWLVDPEQTNGALQEHLRTVLMTKGKARLEAKDHLGALQLFNRLLAMDENNAEVIDLVQSLHQPVPERTRAWRWVAAALATLALAGGPAWYWLARAPDPQVVETPPVEPPSVTVVAAPPPSPPFEIPAAVPPARPQGSATSTPRTPVIAPVAAVQVAPASPGLVTVTSVSAGSVEVWLDGAKVGETRSGPATSWVATRKNPLQVGPGSHTLEFRQPFAETQVENFDIRPSERKDFTVSLRRRPVTFIVKKGIDRGCRLLVDGKPWGTVGELKGTFELRDPGAETQLLFECDDGTRHTQRVGLTNPGETHFVPDSAQ